MPTIQIQSSDLHRLLGQELTEDQLEKHLELVKGELKRNEEENERIKIELNDTNRPDTWSVEGIARQFRYALGGSRRPYAFFEGEAKYRVEVLSNVLPVRPIVGAFVVRDVTIDAEFLEQIIQTQEKLSENFGSKRRAVAIGVYNLGQIAFPVIYGASSPSSHRFVPLGEENTMDLQQILETHPKGVQYGDIVRGFSEYPLLKDSADTILSFPPIINSRSVGEVTTGSTDLFVEATGEDLQKITLALNILAYNFADRGGRIERVSVHYPKEHSYGDNIFPRRLSNEVALEHSLLEKLVGEQLASEEVIHRLRKYGCDVEHQGERYLVKTEEYRNDYLHSVDAAEDFLISAGFNSFQPEAPSSFTIGGIAESTSFVDYARGILVGFGFEEIFSNMLLSKEEVLDKSKLPNDLLEIDNVMSGSYGVVRNSILPCLLRVESGSAKVLYPHRLFEIGEVAFLDKTQPEGSRTEQHACLAIAHPRASFSELHSYLHYFLYYLGYEGTLTECETPWLIPGRTAEIGVNGKSIGIIGELHPEVLIGWDIKVPVAVAEIDLSKLMSA